MFNWSEKTKDEKIDTVLRNQEDSEDCFVKRCGDAFVRPRYNISPIHCWYDTEYHIRMVDEPKESVVITHRHIDALKHIIKKYEDAYDAEQARVHGFDNWQKIKEASKKMSEENGAKATKKGRK